jgi:hypothetical protein
MATPPFQNTRLNKHEEPTKEKLEELFESLTRNQEDSYAEFASVTQMREAINAKRTISGVVAAVGSVAAGSGFTSERTGTGVYKITLQKELSSVGVLTATPIASALLPEFSGAAKKVLTVAFYTESARLTLANTAFSFIIRQT